MILISTRIFLSSAVSIIDHYPGSLQPRATGTKNGEEGSLGVPWSVLSCSRCCWGIRRRGGDAGCLLLSQLDCSASRVGAVCTTDYCPVSVSIAAVAAVVAVAWLLSLPLT